MTLCHILPEQRGWVNRIIKLIISLQRLFSSTYSLSKYPHMQTKKIFWGNVIFWDLCKLIRNNWHKNLFKCLHLITNSDFCFFCLTIYLHSDILVCIIFISTYIYFHLIYIPLLIQLSDVFHITDHSLIPLCSCSWMCSPYWPKWLDNFIFSLLWRSFKCFFLVSQLHGSTCYLLTLWCVWPSRTSAFGTLQLHPLFLSRISSL